MNVITEAPPRADTSEAKLHIAVVGGARFLLDGREIELRNRKARAIFAYIALNEADEEQREKLAGLFWSEFSEKNARATLRQAIHEFREALVEAGCDAVTGGRATVGLKPGSYTVDLHDILAAVANADPHEALLAQERLAETLLAGYDDLDPSFNTWLLARRQSLHDRLIRGLEDGYRDPAHDRRRRRLLAEATLRLDPTHEEACRVVMRAAAEAGETGAALRVYEELYNLLDADYDTEPSPPTQELIADIKLGKFEIRVEPEPVLSFAAEMRGALVAPKRSAVPVGPRSTAPKPALFVPRFAVSGVDPERAHLVDGFRTELMSCLARFREWYVSGTDIDSNDHQLGLRVSARYAVSATAYQAGALINVVMVLQERPSELTIWGERFELSLENWFDVQQHIVRRIAATMNIQVSSERLARFSHLPEISLEAYDSWLRGQDVILRFNAGEWNRAVEMFARGIEAAPSFSPLYSSLAQMHNAAPFVQPGLFRNPETVAHTVVLAQKAVSLDPRDSRAELCLGWALAMSRRYSSAKIHMDLARELNGLDAWTLVSSAMFHAFCGEAGRAKELADLAQEMTLSPSPAHWTYEASIRYLRGDYVGTVEAADRAQDALLTVPAWRAAALCSLGDLDTGRREMRRFLEGAFANWVSEEPPTAHMVGAWFLHVFPISRADLWQCLRDGIALAGIPVDGLVHTGAPIPG